MKKTFVLLMILLINIGLFALNKGDIVINEAHYDVAGAVECVEFKNMTNVAIPLDGLTVKNVIGGSYTFSGTGINIPANGFIAINRNSNVRFDIIIGANIIATLNGTVSIDFNEIIEIIYGGVSLDAVKLDKPITKDTSMIRDEAGNWYVGVPSLGFDNKTPSVNTGKILINEIMWDGDSEEYIELKNMTNQDITMSNWMLLNAGSSTSATKSVNISGTIPANGFFLVYDYSSYIGWTARTAGTELFETTALSGKLVLNDADGEVIALQDNNNNTVDKVSLKNINSGGWYAGVDGAKISMERYQSNIFPPGKAGATDNVSSWYSNTGLTSAAINANYSIYSLATGGKGTPGDNNSVFINIYDTTLSDNTKDYNITPSNILYGKIFTASALGDLNTYISKAEYLIYDTTSGTAVTAWTQITDTVNWMFNSGTPVTRGHNYRIDVKFTDKSNVTYQAISSNGITVISNPTTGTAVIKNKEGGTIIPAFGGTLPFGNTINITGSTSDLDSMTAPVVHTVMYNSANPSVKIFETRTSGGAVIAPIDIPNYIFDVGEHYVVSVKAVDPENYLNEVELSTVNFMVTGFEGEYFNAATANDMSTWTSQYKRIESKIDFDWAGGDPDTDSGTKLGSPIGAVNSDRFGAVWRATFEMFENDDYYFYASSDDGMRVYIDGIRIIDSWIDRSVAETKSTSRNLSAGIHTIKVEYYENGGSASAKVSWQRTAGGPKLTFPQPIALYFNPPEGVYTNSVNVSVSITGSAVLSANSKIYYTTDGTTPTLASTSGYPTVNKTFTDTTIVKAIVATNDGRYISEVVSVSYVIEKLDIMGGTYYKGINFNEAVYTRPDQTINFDWGTASPDSGIYTGVPADNFSVRWATRFVAPYTGAYTFITYSDDGVRLWVNNTQIINQWNAHALTTHTGIITLTAGQEYNLKMEYYEQTGYAVAKLKWIMPADSENYEFIFPFYQKLVFTPASGAYANAQNVTIAGVDAGTDIYYTTGSGILNISTGIKYTTSSPININSTSVLRAIYLKNGVQSEEYSATYIIGSNLKSGRYYNGMNFDTFVYSREDAHINFNWGGNSPNSTGYTGVGADTFSVRWLMSFKAPISGIYTFRTQTDDGVRVFVNNSQIINNWTNHSSTSNSGTTTLASGQTYVMRMEYFENTGSAEAQLYWTIPGMTNEVLFPDMPMNPAVYKDSTMAEEIKDNVWSNTGGDKKVFLKFADINIGNAYKYRYTLTNENNVQVKTETLTTTSKSIDVIDNEYTLKIELLSSADVVLMSYSMKLRIDDTPPVVSISDYDQNYDVAGAKYNVYMDGVLWSNGGVAHNRLVASFNATDARSGVDTYTYTSYVSGNLAPFYTQNITFSAINTVSFSAIVGDLADGIKYVQGIAATDRAGNKSDVSYSSGVKIDTVSPQGWIYDIRNDMIVTTTQTLWANGGDNKSKLCYSAVVEDAESGIDTGSYFYSAYLNNTVQVTALRTVGTLSSEQQIDSGILLQGKTDKYIQWITVSDNVGNSKTLTSSGVWIDYTVPDTTGMNFKNLPTDAWANGGADQKTLLYSFDAAKDIDTLGNEMSGISKYEYGIEVDGISITAGNLTTAGGVKSFTVANKYLDGQKVVQKITVWDNVGNRKEVTTSSITVDTISPTINSLTFWENGNQMAMVNDKRFTVLNDSEPDSPITSRTAIDVQFVFNTSDNISGVSHINFRERAVDFVGTNYTWLSADRGGVVLYPEIMFTIYDNAGNFTDYPYTNISFDDISVIKPKLINVEIDSYGKKKKIKYTEAPAKSGNYKKEYLDSNE